MVKIEKRIERLLEYLIADNVVDVGKFLDEFDVSESTLRRDFNRVIKYIALESVRKDYSIELDVDLKKYITNINAIALKMANDEDPINQSFLENLFHQINKLPKRNDLKYKEIEKFNNYEMTYCIVNEMAIRNKRIAKLVKVFHKLVSFQDKKNEKCNDYRAILQFNTTLADELKHKYNKYLDSCNIYSKKITIDKIYSILKNDYMVSPLECKIDGIDYIPKLTTYTTLQKFDNQDIKSILNGELKLNTNLFDLAKRIHAGNLDTYVPKDKDGFNLEQKIYNDNNEFEYSIIQPNFSRNIIDNNVSTLSINFSLPKEEIISYISHIKDSLYPKQQEKRIKTPEEITHDEIYSSNFTKLKTSEISNYFFIYDFVSI